MRFTVDGYRVLSGSQAPISLSGTSAPFIDVTQGSMATIAAPLSGPAGFRKTGAGVLVLTGSNVYNGPTLIEGGTLVLGTSASMASSPLIRVESGATIDLTQQAGGYIVPWGQTLAGTGTVAASVLGVGAGATLSPGASLGTLALSGSMTFGSGGNYNWQMLSGTGTAGTTSTWDLMNIVGSLSIASTSADPFKINLWTLSGISPDVSGSATNFSPSNNYTWKIASATGGISGFAANKFLISTSATNGTGGFANLDPFGPGTFSVAQVGNDLNLLYAPVTTIAVASGTQTQTQAGFPTLSGSLPLVKTGGGTLVLTAANTLTGSTTVQQGTLQLANDAALGSSKVIPVAGGTVSLAPYLQTTVGGLAPNAGGLVDLGSGLVTVANGLSPTDLVTAIVAGRGDGSWTGTSGITSSVAAANLASSIPRAVGWLDNGDGSVTAAFAAPGDTNIDWQVDVVDALNFVTLGKFDTGLPATWLEGDFNYDGVVDILDALDFFNTGLYDAGSYNTAPGIVPVPEPASFGLAIATGIAGWLLKRRGGYGLANR
jgi:autotransporter-associated beta strand protein